MKVAYLLYQMMSQEIFSPSLDNFFILFLHNSFFIFSVAFTLRNFFHCKITFYFFLSWPCCALSVNPFFLIFYFIYSLLLPPLFFLLWVSLCVLQQAKNFYYTFCVTSKKFLFTYFHLFYHKFRIFQLFSLAADKCNGKFTREIVW